MGRNDTEFIFELVQKLLLRNFCNLAKMRVNKQEVLLYCKVFKRIGTIEILCLRFLDEGIISIRQLVGYVLKGV